jgi:kynurenine formamidase
MLNFNDFENVSLIDLTHCLSTDIPQWENNCGFQCINSIDYNDCDDDVKFRVQKIEMVAGIGTHMDAPAHCVEGGKTIANIGLQQLMSACVVIDVSDKANESYKVTADDILEFENVYGKISKNVFVIFHTGWGRFWDEPDKYRNNLNFPCVSREAAELLVGRDITGIGIDTLSPDRSDGGFPVHHVILNAGKYIIENVANSDKLPKTGSYIIALPMKIKDGTEAPVRLVGILE